jgi:hypothetical protein
MMKTSVSGLVNDLTRIFSLESAGWPIAKSYVNTVIYQANYPGKRYND